MNVKELVEGLMTLNSSSDKSRKNCHLRWDCVAPNIMSTMNRSIFGCEEREKENNLLEH